MSSSDLVSTPPSGRQGTKSKSPRAGRLERSFASLARGTNVGGRYIVLEELGRGGMAIVYRAYDPELERLLALKLILHRSEEARASERLLREAQALAQLSHPNVVAVYDVGTFGSSVFMAMELVEGPTLRTWLRQERRSTQEIIDRFLAAGEGLRAAHRARIVHRDFKPGNVLIGSDGRVRVADFGLARSERSEREDAPSSPHRAPLHSDAELTAAGAILGTPEYMSPEQHRGDWAGELSDQYSFCVSLFEAFFGWRPLDGEDAGVAVRQSSVRNDVPRKVCAALTRGLATAPEARFTSMDALLGELGRARHARRPWGPIAAAVIAVMAIFAANDRAMRGRRETSCRDATHEVLDMGNPERRSAMLRTFMATGLPYAGHAFASVARELDAYARDWAATYTDACEATRLRGEQSEEMLDRRMACLAQRRAELVAASEIFARADAALIERAAMTAKSLTPIQSCSDLAALAARVMPPDNFDRAELARAWGDLGRAKWLYEAGRHAEGQTLARDVVRAAEGMAYAPIEADAKLIWARFREAEGAYGDAERVLRQALRAARVGGVLEVSVGARIELVRVVGLRLERSREAHEWARDAEVQLLSSPGPTAPLGLLLSAESALFYREGRLAEAAKTGEKACEILERTLGPESPALAEILERIGRTEADLGHDEKARIALDRARAIRKTVLGPSHPAAAGPSDLPADSGSGGVRGFSPHEPSSPSSAGEQSTSGRLPSSARP